MAYGALLQTLTPGTPIALPAIGPLSGNGSGLASFVWIVRVIVLLVEL
jgi:hypothetical protein